MLMLAAGLGQEDYLRALLDAGADRKRATARYKMLPLYIAAQTGHWRCTQILLGGDHPRTDCVSRFLSLRSASLLLKMACLFSTPHAPPDGKVIRRRGVSS